MEKMKKALKILRSDKIVIWSIRVCLICLAITFVLLTIIKIMQFTYVTKAMQDINFLYNQNMSTILQ